MAPTCRPMHHRVPPQHGLQHVASVSRRAALLNAAAAFSVLLAPAERASAGLFGLRPSQLSNQLASQRSGVLNSPPRFGSKAKPRVYTAETLLLSQLPVQCPPLDLLQTEAEKFYVLRRSNASWASPEASSAAVYDWAALEMAREEALSALLESRSLFKLFFDKPALKKGGASLEKLQGLLRELEEPIAAHDAPRTLAVQTRVMRELVTLGNLAVPVFPYAVCKAVYCEGRPRLLGRATVELVVGRVEGGGESFTLTAVLDGYAAPLTAGNFVDLIQRGFYGGLPFGNGGSRMPATVVGSGAVVSGGQPAALGGNITGFVDPRTGSYRTVPLEILSSQTPSGPEYRGERLAIGNAAAGERGGDGIGERGGDGIGERAGAGARARGAAPAVPFRARGTIGMVHSSDDPNDASSEFFILADDLDESSPIARELDGSFAPFGFILDGAERLPQLGAGYQIVSARVVSGAENARRADFNPTYQGRAAGNSKRDYQMLGGEGLGDDYENALPADVPLAPGDLDSRPDRTPPPPSDSNEAM